MRGRSAVLAVAVTGLLLSSCASGDDDDPVVAGESPAPTASGSPSPTSEPAAAVDPASVEANELAMVPVMMYHQVKAAGEYDQTLAEFKAELERLNEADFVPITTAQLIAGEIDIPAGKHPVVLTFDDSTVTQIQIGADGKPTPDSAVGVMEAFEAENPEFTATASFYVNSGPFADDKAVPWLVENGYEVGVHTLNHINLKQSSDALIQKEFVGNIEEVQAAAPDAAMSTIALPFGISPTNKALLRSGSSEGTSYTLKGALLVGSNPAKSPFNSDFDPYAISRIRSGPKSKPVDTDSTFWLDLLDEGKWTPYTSDGDPEKISFPSTSSVEIGEDWADQANEYDPAGSTDSGTDTDSDSDSDSTETASPEPTATSEETDSE